MGVASCGVNNETAKVGTRSFKTVSLIFHVEAGWESSDSFRKQIVNQSSRMIECSFYDDDWNSVHPVGVPVEECNEVNSCELIDSIAESHFPS